MAYEGERGGATAGNEWIDRDRAVAGSEGDRRAAIVRGEGVRRGTGVVWGSAGRRFHSTTTRFGGRVPFGLVGVVFGVAVFVPHPYGAGRLDLVLARRVAR
ncbi:MAG TPA: hypothetical protein VGD84_04160 [Pseudonocardiaceae bacterium]